MFAYYQQTMKIAPRATENEVNNGNTCESFGNLIINKKLKIMINEDRNVKR